jgi:hypothetical protein
MAQVEVPMTYARKTLVSLNDTPYYHVVARCVRRAWLWGFDEYAGRTITASRAVCGEHGYGALMSTQVKTTHIASSG